MSNLLSFVFLAILGVFLLTIGIGYALFVEGRRKKQVEEVLGDKVSRFQPAHAPVILFDPAEKQPWIERLINRLDVGDKLETAIQQSGLEWSVSGVIIASAILAVGGLFLGRLFNFLLFPFASQAAGLLLLGSLPYLYVSHQRRSRLREIEEEFPEALDFLARAMRSGHAFSISLEMLGEESPEPLAKEIRTTFNEQNLGAPLETALLNLVRRVPLVDVRFFTSAVLLQRQTGGNLSEILNRLSYVIRERFRLRGHVRAASAHGRLTAGVLTCLPIVTMIGLSFVAPGYLQSMAHDPDGRYLIAGAIVAMVAGYIVMRRIVNIKV